MQTALRMTATVQPGNKIEVTAPELREGEDVDVFLVLPEPPPSSRRSALEIITSLKGHRSFQSAEEVNQYLQEERDSWDR